MFADHGNAHRRSWDVDLPRRRAFQGSGKPFAREAAMAKLLASGNRDVVDVKAVQIHGGYGRDDFPVERYMRDAKLSEIGEGTRVQRE